MVFTIDSARALLLLAPGQRSRRHAGCPVSSRAPVATQPAGTCGGERWVFGASSRTRAESNWLWMGLASLGALGNSKLKKRVSLGVFCRGFGGYASLFVRSCSEKLSRKPSLAAERALARHRREQPHRLPALRCRLMIYKLLYRIPGGHAVQVFTGVCLVLGIGCAPVLYKKTRAGHDYFSSEKPEAVERGTVNGV